MWIGGSYRSGYMWRSLDVSRTLAQTTPGVEVWL